MYRIEYYDNKEKLKSRTFETSDEVARFIVKNELTDYWFNNTFRLEV